MIGITDVFEQTRIDNNMAMIKTHGVLVDIATDIATDVHKPYVTMEEKGII